MLTSSANVRPGWSAAKLARPASTRTPCLSSRRAMSADWLAASRRTRSLTTASCTATSPAADGSRPTAGASRNAVTFSEVAIRVFDGTQS